MPALAHPEPVPPYVRCIIFPFTSFLIRRQRNDNWRSCVDCVCVDHGANKLNSKNSPRVRAPLVFISHSSDASSPVVGEVVPNVFISSHFISRASCRFQRRPLTLQGGHFLSSPVKHVLKKARSAIKFNKLSLLFGRDKHFWGNHGTVRFHV